MNARMKAVMTTAVVSAIVVLVAVAAVVLPDENHEEESALVGTWSVMPETYISDSGIENPGFESDDKKLYVEKESNGLFYGSYVGKAVAGKYSGRVIEFDLRTSASDSDCTLRFVGILSDSKNVINASILSYYDETELVTAEAMRYVKEGVSVADPEDVIIPSHATEWNEKVRVSTSADGTIVTEPAATILKENKFTITDIGDTLFSAKMVTQNLIQDDDYEPVVNELKGVYYDVQGNLISAIAFDKEGVMYDIVMDDHSLLSVVCIVPDWKNNGYSLIRNWVYSAGDDIPNLQNSNFLVNTKWSGTEYLMRADGEISSNKLNVNFNEDPGSAYKHLLSGFAYNANDTEGEKELFAFLIDIDGNDTDQSIKTFLLVEATGSYTMYKGTMVGEEMMELYGFTYNEFGPLQQASYAKLFNEDSGSSGSDIRSQQ